MLNTISDFEKNGGTYTKVGDYYLPDLVLPPEKETRFIGTWGRRRQRYLMIHDKALFTIMAMSNTLYTHLADINEQADEMFLRLVKEMAKSEGVTEQLKAENQMLWVRKMNNIRNGAMEIVLEELIYS